MQKSTIAPVTQIQLNKVLTHALGGTEESVSPAIREFLTRAVQNPNSIAVETIDNGFWNPIYFISCEGSNVELVLKVCNPAWKSVKTLNEALVIRFVNRYIPECYCPELVSFDNTGDLIGLEYILMTRCQGIPLSDIFSQLSREDTRTYSKQIAAARGALSRVTFLSDSEAMFGCVQDIQMEDEAKRIARVKIGPNADLLGPFVSFSEYIIGLTQNHFSQLESSQNGRFKYLLPKYQAFCNLLRGHSIEVLPEEYTICHCDIAPKNVLVNPDTKQVTGIVDWEWAMFSTMDSDIGSILEDWSTDEEDREFIMECLKESSKSPMLTNATAREMWPGFQRRKLICDISDTCMSICSYKDWYVGNEQGAEEYIQRVFVRLEEEFKCFETSFTEPKGEQPL